jgi:propionate CoA-transferase
VDRIVPDHSRDPKSIRVPGIFVDAVVVAPPELHAQTFAEQLNPLYTRQGDIAGLDLPPMPAGPRRWICARAADEIARGDIVNLGIDMPEGVALIARERGRLDDLTLTVESGPIGGVPAGGLSFGAARLPQAIIDQPYMFDFYDGGGLDVAFLGMAQADRHGNVNVSRFAGRVAGIGGFMNISQNARKIVFCGTFTAGGFDAVFQDGRVRIVTEGRERKFLDQVEHITYSGAHGRNLGQHILFITERAVFRYTGAGLELVEIAPGIDLQRDVLAHMDFPPVVSRDLIPMPDTCFA